MLTLFDIENTKIGLLENLKDFVILEKLKNGSSTISFSLYRNDPYCKQIKEECYVETLDNRYIVKIINNQQTVIRYTCELDLESLTSKIWSDGFSNVRANVIETVKLAISGAGWTVIDGGVNKKKRTINLKAMDSYEIIKNCLTKWDVEVKFDAKKRIITLADKIGSDKGVYFSDELNLTTIHVESDSRSFATRLYVRGKDGLTFASINGGKDYIEDYSYTSKLVSKIWIDERYENAQQLLEDARLKLNDFCKPKSTYELEVVDLASLSNEYSFLEYGIGDFVTLLSASKEIREVHRIVEIAKYPLEPERNTATLSNGLLTFEESQEKNDAMAENVDSVLNEDGTLNGSKVDGIRTEQIVDFEAKVISVVDLSVVNAQIENLETSKASIEQLSAVQADIGDLRVNTATIDQLKVTEARINVLEANDVKVNGLLEASSAKINVLEATSAEIKHLLAGNLSSENIQAGGITSDKLTIANGFIKDAMIDSLNANKITAGQINTALVQVASSSGNLVIQDNTIQIRDANRVRVQIGKDASNDYSMSVWDSNGKLMFDARGLKADAIKDSIIRNEMISDNANIDGSKLNISSVVSEINEGSTTLKASKIQIDGVAQTLEVAFNVLKAETDETKSQIESHTTAINVIQGKINTLIQDTTITKDGQTTKLKDEYSKLEQTVGSLSSTIGKQQTTIDEHTGKITAFDSEMVSLKQNLDGLSADILKVQTDLNDNYSTTTETETLIEAKAGEISLAVAKTEVNKTLKNYPTTSAMNSAILQKANEITSTVEVTKSSGVEIIPQSYTVNSTSGFKPIFGHLDVRTDGLLSRTQSQIETDFIPVDRTKPIHCSYDFATVGNGQTCIFFMQYKANKDMNGDNNQAICLVDSGVGHTGRKMGEYTINAQTLLNGTRYVKLRLLVNWDNNSAFQYTYFYKLSALQLQSRTASTQIAQMSDQIALKVEADGVKSIIQQNPESVRIGFNAISNYFDLNSTRLQVGHSDGSYTQIGQNGIVYYDSHANWKYHSLMKQGWLGDISGTSWSRTVTLPASFRNKTFSVIISVEMVNAVNTHDVIKHYKVTVPQNTVNYANGTFVINMSALAYWVPGQGSATDIITNVSWIAIA